MEKTLVKLAIGQSVLFAGWPAEAVARVVALAEVETMERGTCIMRSGDQVDFVYLLATGSMALRVDNPQGRAFTVAVHLAGDFHGLGTVMARSPQSYSAVCKEKSVLIRIPGALLRDMVSHDGRLAFSLFAAQESRRKRALHRHEAASVYSVRARVADLLTDVGSRDRRSERNSEIYLSQEEIAGMLGTTRQVVNKVLGEISTSGAIDLRYGKIVIVDAGKLRSLARDTAGTESA